MYTILKGYYTSLTLYLSLSLVKEKKIWCPHYQYHQSSIKKKETLNYSTTRSWAQWLSSPVRIGPVMATAISSNWASTTFCHTFTKDRDFTLAPFALLISSLLSKPNPCLLLGIIARAPTAALPDLCFGPKYASGTHARALGLVDSLPLSPWLRDDIRASSVGDLRIIALDLSSAIIWSRKEKRLLMFLIVVAVAAVQ